MELSPQRVAFVDPYSEGHHLPWAVEFCASLLREGKEVQAFFPEPSRLREGVKLEVPHLVDNLEGIETSDFAKEPLPKDRVKRPYEALKRWRQLDGMLRDLPRTPDLIFFAYLDAMLSPGLPPLAVDRAFTFPWCGVYLHPVWTRVGRKLPMQLREGWPLRASGCTGVGLLDEGLIPRFERMLPGKNVCQVPDFLSEKTERSVGQPHEEILERADGRTIVGLVGTLQSRKGVATLLRAAHAPRGRDSYFVFAGQLTIEAFDEPDRALLESVLDDPPDNVWIHPRAIPSERTFVSIAQACDILFAAYRRFPHSSNILALASLLRRPVIVSQGHLMEERALRFKLGPAVPEDDPAATLDAIGHLRADLASHKPLQRHFESYLRTHSRARLQRSLRILIDGDDKAKPQHSEAGSTLPAA